MNTMKKEAEVLPEDVELLLPWHAAGTLSRRDAARVEQALANDNELAARYELVREELGEAIRLNESLGAPSARAMQSLFAKIDAEPARKPKVSFNLGAWLTDFVGSFQPRWLGCFSRERASPASQDSGKYHEQLELCGFERADRIDYGSRSPRHGLRL